MWALMHAQQVSWIGIIVFWNRKEDMWLYHISKLFILLFGYDTTMFLLSFVWHDYIGWHTRLNVQYVQWRVHIHPPSMCAIFRRWPKLFTWLYPFASFVEMRLGLFSGGFWFYYNFSEGFGKIWPPTQFGKQKKQVISGPGGDLKIHLFFRNSLFFFLASIKLKNMFQVTQKIHAFWLISRYLKIKSKDVLGYTHSQRVCKIVVDVWTHLKGPSIHWIDLQIP